MDALLTLVRHSLPETLPNVPAREWRLSEEGRRRARDLCLQLAPLRLSRFIASEEPKARETGEVFAQALGVACDTHPNLHEHERRTVPLFASHEAFRAQVVAALKAPDKLVLGEETATEARVRFTAAVRASLASYPKQHLAIVTHGTVMALLVAHANRLDPVTVWQSLAMPSFVRVTVPDFTLTV
jgi:broad specificity phosphatase PhoE